VKEIEERRERLKAHSEGYRRLIQRSENVVTPFDLLDELKQDDPKKEKILKRILEDYLNLGEDTIMVTRSSRSDKNVDGMYVHGSDIESGEDDGIQATSMKDSLSLYGGEELVFLDGDDGFVSGEDNIYAVEPIYDDDVSGEEVLEGLNEYQSGEELM
jgi:hypothetical protein